MLSRYRQMAYLGAVYVWTRLRRTPPPSTPVPRYEFVGAHLTPPVKAALRIEAQRARVSMSQLVYEAIVTQLRARGHAV